MGQKITVTQPQMPPLEEFIPYLERIWQARILTNSGPLHMELEQALSSYLGVKRLALFANGTLALIAVIKALGINGEVITTPYSFVATTHALAWQGLEPVFADIDPLTLNLDPTKIELAITPRTAAILPVHCYGTPCDTSKIDDLARRHRLRVIYDAAHAFGVSTNGRSILQYGDASVLSLHATKVFSTGEGGAVICHDDEVYNRLCRIRNFGIVDEVTVDGLGINGKLPELSAAFGLLQLKYASEALARRREIDFAYRKAFSNISGIRCLPIGADVTANYGYFPIFIQVGHSCSRDDLYYSLRSKGILARRYFYPLISKFPIYANAQSSVPENLPVAEAISTQVLCLPIYPAMTASEQEAVIRAVLDTQHH